MPNEKDEPLVDWMRRPANHIRLKYEEYQEYLARIPALKQKPVPIALDESATEAEGPARRRAAGRPRGQRHLPAQTLRLEIRGAALTGKGTPRRMAPQSLTATVAVGQQPGVRIEEQGVASLPRAATFAPFSVNIYELPVKAPARSARRRHHPNAVEGDGR